MAKYVCSVCGYVHEGDAPPAECPICKAPAEKFNKQEGELVFADEHVIGVAKGVDERIIEGLRQNFTGECTEVGMYLAMSRAAHREGYPEIMPQNLLNFWAKSFLRPQRKILKSEFLLSTELVKAKKIWQNLLKNSILMQFMIQFTKWQKMKRVTAKALKVCSIVTFENKIECFLKFK